MNRGLTEKCLNYNQPTIRNNLLELISLPFIPFEDLQEIFNNLMDNLNESVVDFSTYIESTYIREQPVCGRRQVVPPKFPSEMCNAYELVLCQRQRTNNIVEGIHSKLRKVLLTHHSNIWKFLENMKNFQEET